MRGHKYRARLKIKLGELPVGSWVYFCLQDTHFNDIIDWETCCDWTGLHDKNGTEIYEGDILKFCYYYEHGQWGENKTFTKVIEWNDFDCGFTPMCRTGEYEMPRRYYEVIGNIFENGDLLK